MPQQHEGGGVRLIFDPKSKTCDTVLGMIEKAETSGKISGGDHAVITVHLQECPECQKTLGPRLKNLELEISD